MLGLLTWIHGSALHEVNAHGCTDVRLDGNEPPSEARLPHRAKDCCSRTHAQTHMHVNMCHMYMYMYMRTHAHIHAVGGAERTGCREQATACACACVFE